MTEKSVLLPPIMRQANRKTSVTDNYNKYQQVSLRNKKTAADCRPDSCPSRGTTSSNFLDWTD